MTQDVRAADASPVNGITKSASAANVPRTLPHIYGELRRKVIAFLEEETDDEVLRNVQKSVRVSMGVIEQALRQYKLEQLSISYNGGKDCVVMLILILACLPAIASSSDTKTAASPTAPKTTTTNGSLPSASEPHSLPSLSSRPLQGVYVVSQHPFPEVEAFVTTSAIDYHLDLAHYALPMRPALEAYLGENKNVEAIFVGTRRTDPHGKFLTHFDLTDKDWPRFMRIHPVIDWHYSEIWTFIRHLDIPYCNLYDQGFTSLGGVTDTQRNPALAVDGDTTKFRPAYELTEDDEERLGRDN